jgi:hypothetical protein
MSEVFIREIVKLFGWVFVGTPDILPIIIFVSLNLYSLNNFLKLLELLKCLSCQWDVKLCLDIIFAENWPLKIWNVFCYSQSCITLGMTLLAVYCSFSSLLFHVSCQVLLHHFGASFPDYPRIWYVYIEFITKMRACNLLLYSNQKACSVSALCSIFTKRTWTNVF